MSNYLFLTVDLGVIGDSVADLITRETSDDSNTAPIDRRVHRIGFIGKAMKGAKDVDGKNNYNKHQGDISADEATIKTRAEILINSSEHKVKDDLKNY